MRHDTTQTITRRLLAPLVFLISVLLSTQALAFDVDGLSYSVIDATDVEVNGRTGNTDTDIVIPATNFGWRDNLQCVSAIGGFSFDSRALTSVIIPDSVTTIKLAAFRGNELPSIIIPDSVAVIEGAAFRYNALTQRGLRRQLHPWL